MLGFSEILRLSVTLLTSLSKVYSSQDYISCSDFDHCKYAGTCDVDAEDCWRQMMDEGVCLDACVVYDKPAKPFVERDDFPYWIGVPEERRYRFAEPLAYTVVRLTRNGDIETIPGCCSLSMDSNEKCILPTSNPGEIFYVIIPMNESYLYESGYDDEIRFCVHRIEERAKPDKWCRSENETACWVVNTDGKVHRNSFKQLSSKNVTVDVMCFFPTASEVGVELNEKDSFIMEGLHLSKGENRVRLPNRRRKTYEVRSNVHADDVFNIKPPEDSNSLYSCCIVGNENKNGPTEAACLKLLKVKEDGLETIVIAIIVCCFVVLSAVPIVVIWLYKKHFRECTYNYWAKNVPHHLKGQLMEDGNVRRVSNQSEIPEIARMVESDDTKIEFAQDHVDSRFQDYQRESAILAVYSLKNGQNIDADSGNADSELIQSTLQDEVTQGHGAGRPAEEGDPWSVSYCQLEFSEDPQLYCAESPLDKNSSSTASYFQLRGNPQPSAASSEISESRVNQFGGYCSH